MAIGRDADDPRKAMRDADVPGVLRGITRGAKRDPDVAEHLRKADLDTRRDPDRRVPKRDDDSGEKPRFHWF